MRATRLSPDIIAPGSNAWPNVTYPPFSAVMPGFRRYKPTMSPLCDGCGIALSTVKLNVVVAVLPARSGWIALSVCAPSARPVGVKLQAPVPLAVAVPIAVPPSLMVTRVLASPNPVTVGPEVILPVDELPAPEARAMLSAGAVLSSVKLSVTVPVLPARSVWVAVSARAVGQAAWGEAPSSGVISHRGAKHDGAILDSNDGIGLTDPLERRVRGDPVSRRAAGIRNQRNAHRLRRLVQGEAQRHGHGIAGR